MKDITYNIHLSVSLSVCLSVCLFACVCLKTDTQENKSKVPPAIVLALSATHHFDHQFCHVRKKDSLIV